MSRFVKCKSAWLAVPSAMLLVGACSLRARGDVYGYATQQTSGYSFSGGTMGTINAGSSSSAAQVANPSGSDAHSGVLDALESYVGPAAGKPAENTFTAKGLTTPDYSRGDELVTASPNPFATNNVAELYLTSAGNSSGAGSWSVSFSDTFAAPGTISMSFNYTNDLAVTNTGGALTGTVQAAYSYNFTIQNSSGIVYSTSPSAVNNSISLSAAGSTSIPGEGSVGITSPTLAAGTYTVTISGNETTFANLSAVVPEPSCGIVALASLLGFTTIRRRRR